MRIKALLTCVLLLTGLAMTSAWGQNSDNATIQGWVMSQYWSPVFCADTLTDVLSGGTISVHYVIHQNANVRFYEIDKLKGEVTSQTGEVFKISETDRYYFTDHWYLTWHYNLTGDRGSHYIGTLTYSYFTGHTTVGKTVCN